MPFNMKIGEAGEAFWVFETEDDVPEDLITSPVLEPVKPGTSQDVSEVDLQQDDVAVDGSLDSHNATQGIVGTQSSPMV